MGKQKTAAVGSEARHDTADAGKKSSGTLPAKAVPKEASKQSKLHDAKLKSKPDQLASKKPAAGGSEIDDIFGAAKKKATEAKAAEKRKTEEVDKEAGPEGDAGGGPAKKAKRVEGSKDDIFGEVTAKGRKRTEEGFAIYTEDELGLGRKGGGDTDLCPFDCECCF